MTPHLGVLNTSDASKGGHAMQVATPSRACKGKQTVEKKPLHAKDIEKKPLHAKDNEKKPLHAKDNKQKEAVGKQPSPPANGGPSTHAPSSKTPITA